MSKGEKLGKKVAQPAFDYNLIQGAFKDALSRYFENRKQIQKLLDFYRPALEQITKHANIATRALESVNNELNNSKTLQEVTALQERIKTFVKKFESSTDASLHFPRGVLTIRNPKEIRELPTADEIADRVFQKLEERMKNKVNPINVLPSKNAVAGLPDRTSWGDIRIKFTNKFDVEVYLRDRFLKKYSHEDLGFVRKNTKDRKPDKQWDFLMQLALSYQNIRLLKPTVEGLCHNLKISKASCMKKKEHLAKQLQVAFGIEDDPFHEYNPEEGYITKFKLEPESLLKGSGELHSSGGKFIDNLSHDDSEKNLY